MLALLGWNPGDDREFFSLEELVDVFSIEKVGRSGSKFDQEKAKWFNHHYLLEKSNKELANLFLPILNQKNVSVEQKDVPDNLDAFTEVGATHIILGMGEPWDYSVVEKLVDWRDVTDGFRHYPLTKA